MYVDHLYFMWPQKGFFSFWHIWTISLLTLRFFFFQPILFSCPHLWRIWQVKLVYFRFLKYSNLVRISVHKFSPDRTCHRFLILERKKVKGIKLKYPFLINFQCTLYLSLALGDKTRTRRRSIFITLFFISLQFILRMHFHI